MESGTVWALSVSVLVVFVLAFQLIDARKKLKEANNPEAAPTAPAEDWRKQEVIDFIQRQQNALKGIQITEEFEAVRQELKAGTPVIFVHGGAGVGKSTLIQWLTAQGVIHIKLAPTGLAALNIGGMTIHSFFGFGIKNDFFAKDTDLVSLPQNSQNVLEHARTICIDEVSMVRADLMDAIDRSLRCFSGKQYPFGGYQILMVGDLYQLPPIVDNKNPKIQRAFRNLNTSCDLKIGWESPWCLDADVFKNVKIRRIDLTRVFRQNDEAFVNILNDLRVYRNLQAHLDSLNRKLEHATDTIFKIGNQQKIRVTLTLTNQIAKATNQRYLAYNPNPEHRFIARKTGVYADPQKNMQVPIDSEIVLKENTFVMLICNDPNRQFVNGSTGIIKDFPKPGFVRIKMKSCTVIVGPHTWEAYDTIWDESIQHFSYQKSGTYTQIPIIPAYAITCHKAQGKTISDIFLDFHGKHAFASGQTYVALSRARSIGDIAIAQDLTIADFKPDDRLMEFQKEGRI